MSSAPWQTTLLQSDRRNLVLIPLDPRPVFEAFAGFLTGAESGGQYHAADGTPTPEAQAQTIHLRVDDRFLDRYQCPPFVLPPATSRACRNVSSLRIIPRARPT
jgi:hypothetical protein